MKRNRVGVAVVLSFLCVASIVAATSRATAAEDARAPGATQPEPPTTSVGATNVQSPPAASPIAKGLAVELGTGLSGLRDAALGLGWGAGRVAVGIGFEVHHSSLTGPAEGDSTPELTETALALGPWLRWDLVRGLDGRVGLLGAIDVQYSLQSVTTKTDTSPTRADASAGGVIVRLGPGIRFWATPWMAVGYATQVSISSVSGPLLAFTQSTTLAPSTYQFDRFEVALVGRFSVLALF